MKSNKGKDIIYKLVAQADVVVENFRQGWWKVLEYGYDDMKINKSFIIYLLSKTVGKIPDLI